MEHSKDGMSHPSVVNKNPSSDTGFYGMPEAHEDKHNLAHGTGSEPEGPKVSATHHTAR